MRCPYLSSATKKVCVKMLEAQVSGELNDFDIKHFCDGDPVYCYYFRLPQLRKATESSTAESEEKPLPPLIPSPEKKPLTPLKELLFKPDENP
jgi:hypothetical protein